MLNSADRSLLDRELVWGRVAGGFPAAAAGATCLNKALDSLFARRDVPAKEETSKVTTVGNRQPADQPNEEYLQRRLLMATAEKKRSLLTGFNFSEKECIWMRAKVVPTKYCDNAFDCTTCAFDKGMARKMSLESREAGWDTKMFELAVQDQRCRHALTGRAPQNKKLRPQL